VWEDRPGPGALPHRTPVSHELNLCLSRGIYASQTTQLPESRVNIARIFVPTAAVLAAAVLAGGCATSQPAPITVRELAEAQTFPFYRVYWAGPRFGSYRLVAADGRQNYASSVGDSVYYGNCLPGKTSALDAGGCELPLRVTTLIYTRHANASLGAQRNTILRGVPAVIYNGGNTVELYSGRVAIDVFSDDLSEALRAIDALRPLNAPGSAASRNGDRLGRHSLRSHPQIGQRRRRVSPGFGALPPPVYCPGLSGPQPAAVRAALLDLPGHACQKAAATLKVDRALFGKG
jgi:hypothetical protein